MPFSTFDSIDMALSILPNSPSSGCPTRLWGSGIQWPWMVDILTLKMRTRLGTQHKQVYCDESEFYSADFFPGDIASPALSLPNLYYEYCRHLRARSHGCRERTSIQILGSRLLAQGSFLYLCCLPQYWSFRNHKVSGDRGHPSNLHLNTMGNRIVHTLSPG